MLRDQTQALQKRETRKHNRRDTASARALSDNDLSRALVVQKRSIAAGSNEFLPHSLNVTPEELAISSWFDSFILLYRDQESRRGYLEYLLPLYTSARHDSPLSLATSALAMIVFSGPPSHRPMMDMALKVFGKAMALTRKALQNPVDIKHDQTLMAVLLLSMAEVCCVSDKCIIQCEDYSSYKRITCRTLSGHCRRYANLGPWKCASHHIDQKPSRCSGEML